MVKKKKPKAFINDLPVWCAHDAIVYLDELKRNPQNPNIHTTEQIEMLGKLIQEHGWRNPITVSNLSGMIVRGHGRYLAAVYAGLTEAPVDYQNYQSHVAEVLDLIADNKIAELSHVDDELALELMKGIKEMEGFDVELAGYEPGEIFEQMEEAGDILIKEIETEKEAKKTTTELFHEISEQILRRIKYIIENNPENLKNAAVVVISNIKGCNDFLIIADPALKDFITELNRHIDDEKQSPLSEILNNHYSMAYGKNT